MKGRAPEGPPGLQNLLSRDRLVSFGVVDREERERRECVGCLRAARWCLLLVALPLPLLLAGWHMVLVCSGLAQVDASTVRSTISDGPLPLSPTNQVTILAACLRLFAGETP